MLFLNSDEEKLRYFQKISLEDAKLFIILLHSMSMPKLKIERSIRRPVNFNDPSFVPNSFYQRDLTDHRDQFPSVLILL